MITLHLFPLSKRYFTKAYRRTDMGTHILHDLSVGAYFFGANVYVKVRA